VRLARRALLAAPLVLAAGRLPLAAVPISRMDLHWWKARHEAKLAELRRGPVELVFFGDSITENWERPEFRPAWNRLYGHRHAVNLGFKGDATSHLLWRIMNGEAAGIAPKAAVILIGANNMGRLHWPAGENILGIEIVVAETRRRLPRTKILLLGVLPSGRSAWVDETTSAVNRGLAARFGGGGVPGVTYLDVGHVFLRDGTLDRAQFYDPQLSPPEPALHPTAAAQERMALAMEPTLAGLLR
jgi:lysophospholipase L1-like esterase